MIDLHSHFLPGIDDGAKNVDDSVSMLKDAFSQGVTLCAATPHCVLNRENTVENFITLRQQAAEMLFSSPLFDDKSIPKIVMGAEVYLSHDISEYDGVKQLCYENTDYMLLELSARNDAAAISEWIYNLIIKGVRPIIAHIDRYSDGLEVMHELSGLDVIYQINASKLLSFKGRMLFSKIFRHSARVIVSSDMHNMSDRRCNLLQAFEISKNKYSKICSNMFELGAQAILDNRTFM